MEGENSLWRQGIEGYYGRIKPYSLFLLYGRKQYRATEIRGIIQLVLIHSAIGIKVMGCNSTTLYLIVLTHISLQIASFHSKCVQDYI